MSLRCCGLVDVPCPAPGAQKGLLSCYCSFWSGCIAAATITTTTSTSSSSSCSIALLSQEHDWAAWVQHSLRISSAVGFVLPSASQVDFWSGQATILSSAEVSLSQFTFASLRLRRTALHKEIREGLKYTNLPFPVIAPQRDFPVPRPPTRPPFLLYHTQHGEER